MKKKNKINHILKQTLILFIVAIFLFYLLTTIYTLINKPANIFIIDNGTLFLEEEAEGLIIRQEQVIKGENPDDRMLQIKTEGERVAKGEAIFRYLSEIGDSIEEKIEEIDEEIQEKIQNSNEVEPSDVIFIENQIQKELEGINKITDLQKIKEIKRDIATNIEKKIEIIGDNSKDLEIKNLIDERNELKNELASKSEYVNAPQSGVVSYRVDGLEEKLNTEDFSYANKAFLDSIEIKTGQIIATSEQKGKIINNFESYIAVNLDSNIAREANIGDNVKLQLSNLNEINAQIVYINRENDDSRTIIFKINKKIEELIKYRKLSLTVIWWEYSGFKIPNIAISYENGKAYVTRNRAGYKDKILIKVEKQNELYAIIKNYSRDELKSMGYTEKEINNMATLNLYDEIIIE